MKPLYWVTFEKFGFTDGARWAWLLWTKPSYFAERRCIAVSEVSREDAEAKVPS